MMKYACVYVCVCEIERERKDEDRLRVFWFSSSCPFLICSDRSSAVSHRYEE